MHFFLRLLLGGILFSASLAAEEIDDYLAEWNAKAENFRAEWQKPGGHENAELTQNFLAAAVQADRPEWVDEIAAGGNPADKEILLPTEAENVSTHLLYRLGETSATPYSSHFAWVIRRMTKTRLEAWQPHHGWLFDSLGQLQGEASPPRRDGSGREWYGAFLPDGRWVTTDLWEMDRTLHFFSAKGKWLREVTARQLAPRPSQPDDYSGLDLIGWCRSDRSGKGFVASIGSDGGRSTVFVSPNGKSRMLKDETAPWQLCQPRDLEPKGCYTALFQPSDDLQSIIYFSVPAHGAWCVYPYFQWMKQDHPDIYIANADHNFGFMPGTHDVFIGASDDAGDTESKKRRLKTWFFSENGFCQGWIRGSYLADAAKGKNTWYLDEKNGVTLLNAKLKPIARKQFLLDGAAILPEKVFPDLKLGFFRQGDELILTRWD